MTTTAKQIEFFDDRFYKITFSDGTVDYYASVTTKLSIVNKPGLNEWRGDVGNEVADYHMRTAQERGTRIHHAWEKFVTGGKVVYNSPYNPVYSREQINEIFKKNNGNVFVLPFQDEMYALLKLRDFVKETHPTFLYNEQMVFSTVHKEAGTLDNLVHISKGKYNINGATPLALEAGNYILDIKSGKEIYDENFLQVACYAHCVEEMKLVDKVVGALILHTTAKTKKGIEGFSAILRTKEDLKSDYDIYRHASKIWEYKNSSAKPKVFEFPSIVSLDDSLIKEED